MTNDEPKPYVQPDISLFGAEHIRRYVVLERAK